MVYQELAKYVSQIEIIHSNIKEISKYFYCEW